MEDEHEAELGAAARARCALHPRREAALTCDRCGNFTCGACQVENTSCWTCARRDASRPSRYRPLSRKAYRRAIGTPIAIGVSGLAAVLTHAVFFGLGPTPPSESTNLWLLSSGALAIVVGMALFLRAQHRLGGSSIEATTVPRRHAALRAQTSGDDEHLVAAVEALLPLAYPTPDEHAALLVTLADGLAARGESERAELVREAVMESGWIPDSAIRSQRG